MANSVKGYIIREDDLGVKQAIPFSGLGGGASDILVLDDFPSYADILGFNDEQLVYVKGISELLSYLQLTDKPSISGVTLVGNREPHELGLGVGILDIYNEHEDFDDNWNEFITAHPTGNKGDIYIVSGNIEIDGDMQNISKLAVWSVTSDDWAITNIVVPPLMERHKVFDVFPSAAEIDDLEDEQIVFVKGLSEGLDEFISDDLNNILTLGTDHKYFVPEPPPGGIDDASELISADIDNMMVLGSDNKLFVPEIEPGRDHVLFDSFPSVVEIDELEDEQLVFVKGLSEGLDEFISDDSDNAMELGSDNRFFVSKIQSGGIVDPADILSTDTGNMTVLGSDGKLFTPEIEPGRDHVLFDDFPSMTEIDDLEDEQLVFVKGLSEDLNYNDLADRPTINGVLLEGDLTSSDLNLTDDGVRDYNLLSNRPSINGIILEGDQTSEDLDIKGYTVFDDFPMASEIDELSDEYLVFVKGESEDIPVDVGFFVPDYAATESNNRVSPITVTSTGAAIPSSTAWTVDRDGFVLAGFLAPGTDAIHGYVFINGHVASYINSLGIRLPLQVKAGSIVEIRTLGFTGTLTGAFCYFMPYQQS